MIKRWTSNGHLHTIKERELLRHVDSFQSLPLSLDQKEAILKKKYGGLLPKKPPLISKDHERAFFDSADWALGKQGEEPPGHKPRSMVEALRPKLQPTPHQSLPSRRSSLLPADGEVEGVPINTYATMSK
ncbi:unnamed protein product [Sphagnum troendelagicum]|uniref:cAMP-regulated phosphoprotein 19-related protein n=1 Tax=Sphagnum troendelagicum TaxID=128251 RepID=A0ABP0UP72_9BRYO